MSTTPQTDTLDALRDRCPKIIAELNRLDKLGNKFDDVDLMNLMKEVNQLRADYSGQMRLLEEVATTLADEFKYRIAPRDTTE